MAKSLREKQRELRENEILDTAYQLLLEQGYQKMNMDELAARVGTAKMTIYQHFASKEILAISVVVRGMKSIIDELEPVFSAPLPAFERLEKSILKSIEQRSKIRSVTMELAPATVLQNPGYQAQRERLSSLWANLINQAKAEGSVDSLLSTSVLVRMVFHAFETDYDDLLQAGFVDIEGLAHTLISVVLRGMRA